MKKYIVLAIAMLCYTMTSAQWGTAYTFKGGLTLGAQKWNSQERELKPGGHAAFVIESVDQESGTGLFAQVGIHQKGSRLVFQARTGQDQSGNEIDLPRRSFSQPFNNASVILGAKKYKQLTDYITTYIGIGIRGDYTVSYDLYYGREFMDEYVRRFNYGLTSMGGLEFLVGDKGAFLVELSFHPDISKQIDLPVPVPYYDIRTNQLLQLPVQKVTNFPFEISVGYKLTSWN